MEKIKIIVPLGKPCSGKDSFANNLKEKYPHYEIVSTGQIIRDAKTEGNTGRYYEYFKSDFENVDKAKFANDESINKVVALEIQRHLQEGKTNLIFSGYPRNLKQLETFLEKIKSLNREFNIETNFFHFKVSDQTAHKRAELRIENDIEHGKKIRSEDLGENFQKRLDDYQKKTFPLIEELENIGRITLINADEQTATEVFQEVMQHLEGYYPGKERR